MTALGNGIGTLFLASDAKTSVSLYENIYEFLFVENIVYGIVTIIIVFALLRYLLKKVFFYTSKKEDKKSNRQEVGLNNEGSNMSGIRNNSDSRNHTNTDEIDYSRDLELVAAITVAIMAYMGDDVPEDGLVIRSIRKVNRRNYANNYSD